jgi:hypothetical protein
VHAGRLRAVLELDPDGDLPRVRVEHQHRLGALVQWDVDLPRDDVVRTSDDPLGDRDGLAELVAGVVVGALDRRAGEHVVELVEQDLLPRPAQIRPRMVEAEQRRTDGRPAFGGQDGGLSAALPDFDAGVCRVAAGRMHLQIAAPDR